MEPDKLLPDQTGLGFFGAGNYLALRHAILFVEGVTLATDAAAE